MKGHTDRIFCVCITPNFVGTDMKRFLLIVAATAGRDGDVRLWDPVSYKPVVCIPSHHSSITRMRVINQNHSAGWSAVGFDTTATSDYSKLAIGTSNGHIKIYDIRAGKSQV